MGCDIHSFAEVKRNNKWKRSEEAIFPSYGDHKTSSPFDWRSYELFGFLADVRNYSLCTPISEPRGLPEDSEYLNTKLEKPENHTYGYPEPDPMAYTNKQSIEKDWNYHSLSYLTLKELLDYDYDQTFWDRRISRTTHHPGGGSVTDGAALAMEGEGKTITYREHLGEGYFDELDRLKTLSQSETFDDVRIIFYFDN